MRKLTKKISMLMVLAMLVGLFSGVVSASAASAWSFKSSKYDVAVGGEINMKKNEYADFDLLKDGKAPEGYTVVWESSDEDVVWVNAKTGQLRADKAKKAEDGDKAVISATFTNTKTKKSATRSFTIVVGEVKAPVYTVEQADVTAVLGDAIKFAPVVKNEAGEVVKFATHKSYNGYFLDGKAITNPWTPEAAGEYTVVVAQFASKADVADLAKAVRKDEVKVTVKADLAAEATGVKEITVYGDFAKDAKFAVKKGTQSVSFTYAVAEDGKSAKLAMNNKLTQGTYTVACGGASVDVVVEKDEYAAQIVVFENGGQILTDDDKEVAYVHYDVLNQYGESVRRVFDPSWTVAGADNYTVKRTEGIVELTKKDDKTFNYNDMIVLTGVVTGYGFAESETATMTIGLQQSVDSVEILGIVKGDSTELIHEIPASYVGGPYYLVFSLVDNAGRAMEFKPGKAESDLKFISMEPQLAKFADKVEVEEIYINGVAYGKVAVEKPGDSLDTQLKKGGVAEINITSTKTGNPTPYELRIVSEQVLDTFKVLAPNGLAIRNNQWSGPSTYTLEYEALDTKGEKITDFRALYKAVQFSDKNVKLTENNDGSATLTYEVDFKTIGSIEGFDALAVFSVTTLTSGKSEQVRFNIKPNRYAAYVSDMGSQWGHSEYIVEGNSINVGLIEHYNSNGLWIKFNDQYDDTVNSRWLFDDDKGRYIGVKPLEKDILTVVTGSSKAYVTTLDDGTVIFDAKAQEEVLDDKGNPKKDASGNVEMADLCKAISLKAADDVTASKKAIVVEFAIYDDVKVDSKTTEYKLVGGSDKNFTFYVVDIDQVAEISVNRINNKPYLYPYEKASTQLDPKTAQFGISGKLANGKNVVLADATANYTVAYNANGKGVFVDNAVSGSTLSFTPELKVATGTSIFLDYSKPLADKDGYAPRNHMIDVAAKVIGKDGSLKASAKTSIEVSNRRNDSVRYLNFHWDLGGQANNYKIWLYGDNKDTGLVKAKDGKVTDAQLMAIWNNVAGYYGDGTGETINFDITKLTESENGLYTGDDALKLGKGENALENAEIGDTFVVTYTAGDLSHSVKFTVGSDQKAFFAGSEFNADWR